MGARIAHELERDLIEVVPAFGPDLANGLKASGRSARYGDDPTFPHQNTEDYFEWIDLLTAIDRSRTQFTMIEVGPDTGAGSPTPPRPSSAGKKTSCSG